MLKLVIDATPISPKPSGVGLYVANLIYYLSRLQSRENFQLGIVYQPGFKNWLRGRLHFPDLLKQYQNLYLLPLPVRISNIILDSFPSLLSLYFERYSGYPNIIHGTDYRVYPYKKSLKAISIYDLTFIKYPNYIDSVVKTYSKRLKKCLQWTDIILTISTSIKKDIIDYLDVNPEKIYVTHLASRYDRDRLSAEYIEKLKRYIDYDFEQPYILFVSTIEPRKNIIALISAFNYLKEKYQIDRNLVLIGRKGWRYEPIFEAIEKSPWKSQIYYLNYLSDELLSLFYSQADLFVYPSHYEGFGLPVLEAMTLGCPVVTSNTSSLPEVTGDAAILIDPNEPIDLAYGILKVISDRQLRCDLIQKGKKRAKLFSWERTAIETLKAYRSVL